MGIPNQLLKAATLARGRNVNCHEEIESPDA